MARPTLGDGSAEETCCPGHRHQRGDAHPARRLAKDRDVRGITTEGGDVLLHPGECGDLIEQTEVGNAVSQEEEAIGSETIVEGDADDSIAGETRAIIGWHGSRSVGKGAPMNPDHDRQPRLSQVWGPDIEVQVILTGDIYLRYKHIVGRNIWRLGRCRAIAERFAHAIPGLRWPWRLKSIGINRWRRVRDSFKCRHSIRRAPMHSPWRVLITVCILHLLQSSRDNLKLNRYPAAQLANQWS